MFFLLPPFALILFVCFGVALVWRLARQGPTRSRSAQVSGGGERVDHGQGWGLGSAVPRRGGRVRGGVGGAAEPLVPAALLRGADRTWVVFGSPDCADGRTVAALLRQAEPASEVAEVDARREPLLASAFGVSRLPVALLANRYGQVEARLVGLSAVQAGLR